MTSITAPCFPTTSAASNALTALSASTSVRVVLGLGRFVVLAAATAACIALPFLCIRVRN